MGKPDWRKALLTPVMSLDCESIGLFGETFAYGYTVVDPSADWKVLEERTAFCSPDRARGTVEDHNWVRDNVPVDNFGQSSFLARPDEVRHDFWQAWMRWRAKGAHVVVDCAWPVEAGFLSACVQDRSPERSFYGPYPLLDITTVWAFAGISYDLPREQGEELVHHPLHDARHSVRRLKAALVALTGK